MNKNLLKHLPSVSEILNEIPSDICLHHQILMKIIDQEIDTIRKQVVKNHNEIKREEVVKIIISKIKQLSEPTMKNIINGTGVVLHTGFGRAPLPGKVLRRVAKRLDGYVNLEFDLDSGKRGERQDHISFMMSALCGTESSLMVNNNAAAVLLALNTIADGKEVVVSRGQQVEIGGSFRIPDIIKKSGCKLKEVGTTNRTHLKDYQNAISSETGLLLWVHTSNYVVEGFTKDVSLKELVQLGKENNIPVMADLGSGALTNLADNDLPKEIPVLDIVKTDVDFVTFSGDKLLGGPQAGIIVGNEKILKQMYLNPLYRTLRCDKMCVALMEETLRSLDGNKWKKDNLTHRLLISKRPLLMKRGQDILSSLPKKLVQKLRIKLVESQVEAGSGSLPTKVIDSVALKFQPKTVKITQLSQMLRLGDTPVIGYISGNAFFIDLKAVLPEQIKTLKQQIKDLKV